MDVATPPLTTSPKSAPGRIHGVESLRALAALSVFGFHAVFASGLQNTDSWLKPYASRLEVGVSIFFVISGFLLYRPFVKSHLDGTSSPAIDRYGSSRLLRIVPAYWIALTVIALWVGLAGVFDGPKTILYYGFLQNYTAETVGNGMIQAWSLGVEISFYAFLPLFALAVSRCPAGDGETRWRNQWAAVAILFVTGLLWNVVVLAIFGTDSSASAPLLAALPAYFDQFALGMGLALVAYSAASGRRRLPVGWVGPRASIGCVTVALAAFITASAGIGLHGGAEPVSAVQALAKHLLFSLVAVSLLWVAALPSGSGGPVARFLEMGWLRWLGLVSYGIFLWHLAVLKQIDLLGFSGAGADGALGWFAWMTVAILPVVALASMSWYLVEKPALRMRDSLTRFFRAGWQRRPRWAS